MEKIIQKKIKKNRDAINNILGKNLPLYVVYFTIRRLSKQNEKLVSQIK